MISIYFILNYTNFTFILNLLTITVYVSIIYWIERPKIKETKTPKLF